ncbi:MAG: HAD-IIIA family hydrolase [Clostridia bacterium]|nr:HAD-IIIA family hydrolase [Clostridia bacterium]
MKVAFLDRDGTINRSFWTHEHEGGPEYWAGSDEPELLPGAAEGMRRLIDCGYRIIIITNQYPIGEGGITQDFYDRFTEKLLAKLRAAGVDVLDVFFCPHRRDEGCACCKPRPGMIQAALKKYPGIDMTESFFAGDSAADEGIARACRLPFFGVGRDGGQRIESLADLVRFIS